MSGVLHETDADISGRAADERHQPAARDLSRERKGDEKEKGTEGILEKWPILSRAGQIRSVPFSPSNSFREWEKKGDIAL
jgi:hypothetical protein